MAKYASVPVINGLSNDLHPCQILSDLLTIEEKKGKLKGLNIAYLSDACNVSNSLMLACTKMGMNITVFTPKEFPVNEWAYNEAMNNCHTSRGMVQVKNKIDESISEMDVLYTDKWISMHQHFDEKKVRKLCLPFQINEKLLEKCKEDVIVMHDLPAIHGDEISEGVFEGHHSVVFDQAENRLHAQKALLALLL
jgi:ornithine carbamoyltransferase